jgi:GNAT superfamily N-acetyltransferase
VDVHGPEVQIRKALPSDLDALLEVHRSSVLLAYAHVFPAEEYPFPNDLVREEWRSSLAKPDVSVLVAERDGELRGVISFTGSHVEGFFLHPGDWGTGLADRLYEQALNVARASGSKTWHLWVLEDNPRARRFYERHGWRTDGNRTRSPYPPHPAEVGYTLTLAC